MPRAVVTMLLLAACEYRQGVELPPEGILAFQDGEAIRAIDSVTGLSVPLAAVPGRAFPGPVAPDGRSIAVVTEIGKGEASVQALWVLPLDGSPASDLGVSGKRVRNPNWAPDGQSLVVEWDQRNFSDIYRVPVDGAGPTRLTASEGGSFDASVSPDGQRLLFASSRDGNAEIYTQGVTDGIVTRLTHDAADDTQPAWLSNQRVAWLAFRGDHAGLWAMNVDGSGAEEFALTAPMAAAPTAASPTGAAPSPRPPGLDVIAFAVKGNRLAATVRRGKLDIVVVDWTTKTLVGGILGDERDDTPAWSPAGEWLAFNRGMKQDLWVARADGTAVQRVATGWLPRWAPRSRPSSQPAAAQPAPPSSSAP